MVLVAIGIVVLTGALVVRRLDPELDLARVGGYGFLAGGGIVAAALGAFAAAGVAFAAAWRARLAGREPLRERHGGALYRVSAPPSRAK